VLDAPARKLDGLSVEGLKIRAQHWPVDLAQKPTCDMHDA
jgi:hypothetical protein